MSRNTSAIQEAQAAELIAGAANADLPLVLVGDVDVLSDYVADRTPTWLWPSDHAAGAARLGFPQL